MTAYRLIVAVDRDDAIGDHIDGKPGALPWHLPGDLQAFKERTRGHIVVMGIKTYKSIGKGLPGRSNVILSRSEQVEEVLGENTQVVNGGDFEAFLDDPTCGGKIDVGDRIIFIIGGAAIYEQAFKLNGLNRHILTDLYITRVRTNSNAKTRITGFIANGDGEFIDRLYDACWCSKLKIRTPSAATHSTEFVYTKTEPVIHKEENSLKYGIHAFNLTQIHTTS